MRWLKKAYQIKTYSVNDWPEGKPDPTQYSNERNEIMVREDYDIAADPAGWLVHEQVHAEHGSTESEDYSSYPDTPTEQVAFGTQFRYLKDRGITNFDDLFSLPGFEHERSHYDVLKRIWDSVQKEGTKLGQLEDGLSDSLYVRVRDMIGIILGNTQVHQYLQVTY